MKSILILLFLFGSIDTLYSQGTDEQNSLLNEIQLRQSNIDKASMVSLSSWAIINISYGAIANFNSTGETKYFHQMNAIWNIVNLGIGIPGIIGAYKKKTSPNFKQLYEYQNRIEKVYFLNIGLDVAYITGGAALRLFAKDKQPEAKSRLLGYGNSVILQGGYLLIHDIAVLLMYKTNKKLFERSWKNITFSSNGLNLNIKLN